MAKSGRKPAHAGKGAEDGQPLTTYFRAIFEQNPHYLDTRSNDQVLQHWQDDHPNEKPSNQVKAALANAKSAVRQRRRKRRGGRPKGTAVATASQPVARAKAPSHRLEHLEEQIDDCLSLAKHTDREGLVEVIRLLRKARNEVVWKMGQ